MANFGSIFEMGKFSVHTKMLTLYVSAITGSLKLILSANLIQCSIFFKELNKCTGVYIGYVRLNADKCIWFENVMLSSDCPDLKPRYISHGVAS